MENVVVVIGAGQIGQAIARRVGIGKHLCSLTAARRTRTRQPRSCPALDTR
jgi:ribosomal protein S9